MIRDVSKSESHEGFDFFSGTLYACETITEPVDDVIELELDDDANGDGVGIWDAFCNNDLTAVDSSIGSDLLAVAAAFGFCNNDLTATDSSIGSDLLAAAIFWANDKEFLLLLVKNYFSFSGCIAFVLTNMSCLLIG